MSSGIYTALSGAIARMNATDVISNNLSNINSTGFKKQRVSFSSVLNDAVQSTLSRGKNFSTVGSAKIDFEQGVIADTGRDLDFAIVGAGFFRVQRGAEMFYTRTGTFTRTAEGALVDSEGNSVMSADNQPIVIPEDSFHIDSEGRILTDEGEIGQLALFDLPLEDLVHESGGRFIFNGDAAAVVPSLDSRIMQGSLERSNVNMMQEAALMISNMRSFESYNKVMKNYYDLNSKGSEIATL